MAAVGAVLAHAPKMNLETTFIFNKRLITIAMLLYPITDLSTKVVMTRGRTMKLVRESAKETVAIAESGSSV